MTNPSRIKRIPLKMNLFQSNDWILSTTMTSARYSLSGMMLSPYEYWIVGGSGDLATEIFRSGNSAAPESYVTLPESFGFCTMVMIDETRAVFYDSKSFDVYLFDKTTEEFTLVDNRMTAYREYPFAGKF